MARVVLCWEADALTAHLCYTLSARVRSLGVRRQESAIGGAVANHMRVTLETGPKGKRVVAVAPDWPGLERGAKTEQAAIDRLLSYLPRYAPVAKLAGMEAAFAASPVVDVVEHYPGIGGTDFWGSRSRFRASTTRSCLVKHSSMS